MSEEHVKRMQSAIESPHIALVSKQLILVLPAQSSRPRILPLLPRFEVKLCVKADADCALAAALAFATIMQLRKLRGFPKTTETTTNASSKAASMPAMTNRPRLARA